MKKILNAFTLMEVMICIVIIAIVSSLTIITAKPFDKYNSLLYQRAYNALSLANYNIKANLGAATYPSTPSALCTAITNWINFTSSDCADKTVSILGTDSDYVNDNDDDLRNNNIQFIATNNMKFYVAKFTDGTVSKNVSGNATYNNEAYSFNAMVVVVDINGDRKPNSAVYNNGAKLPDLVAFAMLDTGDVIPLGPPVTDLRYMTPRILYSNGVKLSPPTSYYNAICRAWGEYSNASEKKSIDLYAPLSITSGNFVRPPLPDDSCTADTAPQHCINTTAATKSPCKVISNNYYN